MALCKGGSFVMTMLFRAGMLVVLLLPTIAAAQVPTQVPKISAEQASNTALKTISGRVTSVVIERKRGKLVYVVEIMTNNAGEKDVFVDIDSGEVVGTD
jgi:uncharacterized membrane protein YkoI